MILDTTFLIDLLDGLPEAVNKMKELYEQQEQLLVATPSVFELWTGVARSDLPEKERRKVKMVLESQLVLDLTESSAEEAGMINGTLWKKGIPIDAEDCMIAGVALQHHQLVLTRNVQHFGRIQGLYLATY
mgnify:CR=1 FL=1